MGLDIHLSTTNEAEITGSPDYFDRYFYKHSLSRTFCWLMCRRDADYSGKPELDQIGQITGANINLLYDMNNYPDADATEFHLSMVHTAEEKRAILLGIEVDKAKLRGNLDKVLKLINSLIGMLSKINNLPEHLASTDRDTLDNKVYFADFNLDKGDGYIGNNFGHDLRNFRSYLMFIKSKGRDTVFFTYG